MACRGVHFALTKNQEQTLQSLHSDNERLEYIQEHIEESWDEAWLQETDKAWDAIHRCLTDGTLKSKGKDIREKCILGGKSLYGKDDYIVAYISPEEVKAVSQVLADITKDAFRKKYNGLQKSFLGFKWSNYDGPINDEDFEYTWSYFVELRTFYKKAADANRSIIFTVDQ